MKEITADQPTVALHIRYGGYTYKMAPETRTPEKLAEYLNVAKSLTESDTKHLSVNIGGMRIFMPGEVLRRSVIMVVVDGPTDDDCNMTKCIEGISGTAEAGEGV